MQRIEDEYTRDVKFENLIRFLLSEEMPEIDPHEKLQFISNRIEDRNEYILLIKTVLYPLQRKYRGVLSSLLGVNKIRLEYVIQYDEDTAFIRVKNPPSLGRYIKFNVEIYVQDDNGRIIVKKSTTYENLIPSFLTSFVGKMEDDFLEQMDNLTEDMFRRC